MRDGSGAGGGTTGGHRRPHLHRQADGRDAELRLTQATAGNGIVTTRTYNQATGTVDTVNARLDTTYYPSGLVLKYNYNGTGYLDQVTNSSGSTVYWQADTRDAQLRILQSTAGNNVVTTTTYDHIRGNVSTIQAGANNAVADYAYGFDDIGNLVSRTWYNQDPLIAGGQAIMETFDYMEGGANALNRLANYTVYHGVTAISSKSVAYNDIGNITYKSDVGLYIYTATAPGPMRSRTLRAR